MRYSGSFVCFYFFLFFKTGSLCRTLAVLEFSLLISQTQQRSSCLCFQSATGSLRRCVLRLSQSTIRSICRCFKTINPIEQGQGRE